MVTKNNKIDFGIFEEIKSHPTISLLTHLESVSSISYGIAQQQKLGEDLSSTSYRVGKYHDFAKMVTFFQRHLRGQLDKDDGDLKQHAVLSSLVYYWIYRDIKGFLAIRYHHGTGDDLDDLREKLARESTQNIMNAQINEISNDPDALSFIRFSYDFDFISFKNNYKTFLREINRDLRNYKSSFDDYCDIQLISSILQTADKSSFVRKEAFANCNNTYIEEIIKYKEGLPSTNPLMDNLRNMAFQEVINRAKTVSLDERFFDIFLPTGVAKTLCAYVVAFIFKKRIEEEKGISVKIIYSLPFISIIDQNEAVLHKIIMEKEEEISSELCLSHHCLSETEYTDDQGEIYDGYDARFKTDNWQSSIIITTFVKLFNTLLKPMSKANVHRFHNLTNSIIILDEVQTLPHRYHEILNKLFTVMAKKYNVYIIMVTATQPHIIKTTPLVENFEYYFSQLNRIKLYNHTKKKITIDGYIQEIKDKIKESPGKSFLSVNNTIHECKRVFKALRKKYSYVFCLNSEIIPQRRRNRINYIKSLIAQGKPVIVISTQVVEAGVDLDFDLVFRDIAPLDSIFQVGGRCNRHNCKDGGELHVYYIYGDHNYTTALYGASLIDLTLKLLKNEVYEEKDFFQLSLNYFKAIKNITPSDKTKQIEEAITNAQFERVRQTAHLSVVTSKVSVFVPINKEVNILFEKISEISEKSKKENNREKQIMYREQQKKIWKKLHKYQISVPEKAIRDKDLIVEEKCGTYILDISCYDNSYGAKYGDMK